MRNKTIVLRDYVTDNCVDIFCLTESWVKETETAIISELVPETHVFHNCSREGRGGGVGIILSKFLQGIKSVGLKYLHFECIQVHFTHRNTKIYIYVIYRPPSSVFSEFLMEFEGFLMESSELDGNVFYVGDFNVWIEDLNNFETKQFVDILDNFDLVNRVREPTFISGHVLDLLITRKNDSILGSVNVEPVATISDHMMVLSSLDIGAISKRSKTIYFRNKNNINTAEFVSTFQVLIDFASLGCVHTNLEKCCTNCLTSKYREVTSEYFEKTVPIIEKIIQVTDSNNLWYNSDIKKAKRVLRKSEKLYKKYKTDFYRDRYRQLLRDKCNLVYSAKAAYFSAKIHDCRNDSKKMYGVLNGLLGKRTENDILPRRNSDFLLANRFKDFFLSKVNDIKNSFVNDVNLNNISLIPDYPLVSFDNFAKVELPDMIKILNKINKTHCHNDPFDIRCYEISDLIEPLASYLCCIVNSSFSEGIFPSTEKFSCVRPKIKGQADSELLSSYRPLYNTSIVSKSLESAALSQLLTHLRNFTCFPIVQSAYRQFHSVETAMCKIYNDLVVKKCNRESTLLVLLDLSAAFDTVDQSVLLNDLKILGVGGRVLKWFESFLSERDFSVSVGNTLSTKGKMTTGVPQGSILGPVLFIVYTIELYYLLESLDVKCHFYADDTQIYFSVSDPVQGRNKFHEVYSEVGRWMQSRKLKLNSEKTEILLVGSHIEIGPLTSFREVMVSDTVIPFSEKVKSLGVIIDRDLSLKQNINNIKRKAISNLNNISRISKFIDQPSRMKLVHGLVFSVIDFCNCLCYGLPNSDVHGLQMIINSAARIVTNMPRFSYDRITPVCIQLHILPFKARVVYKICLMTFKALRFGEPKYILNLLSRYMPDTNMNLRSVEAERLSEPILSRVAYDRRCFQFTAPRLFNSLPCEIRMANSVRSFKKLLKTFLFAQAYDVTTQSINPNIW